MALCVYSRHTHTHTRTHTHTYTHTPQEYLDMYDEIPFKVLRFLITEINYGGRVTDDKDRRLMNNLVTNFVGPEVLRTGYK